MASGGVVAYAVTVEGVLRNECVAARRFARVLGPGKRKWAEGTRRKLEYVPVRWDGLERGGWGRGGSGEGGVSVMQFGG